MSDPDVSQGGSLVIKGIEALRIVGTGVGFYFVYDAYSADDVTLAVRLLSLTLGIGLCGTCAVESLFFAEASASEKGYDDRSGRVSPYQIQNGLWFTAATIVSIGIFVGFPTSKDAFVTYLVFVCLFFGLSAVNHSYQAIKHGNLTWQNLNRPFLFAGLIAAALPVILRAI